MGRFSALRFMVAMKAAREFGLPSEHAEAIALGFDARRGDVEHLVDALAGAVVDRGLLTIPDAPG